MSSEQFCICFQYISHGVNDLTASPVCVLGVWGLFAHGLAAVVPKELGSPRSAAARQGPRWGQPGCPVVRGALVSIAQPWGRSQSSASRQHPARVSRDTPFLCRGARVLSTWAAAYFLSQSPMATCPPTFGPRQRWRESRLWDRGAKTRPGCGFSGQGAAGLPLPAAAPETRAAWACAVESPPAPLRCQTRRLTRGCRHLGRAGNPGFISQQASARVLWGPRRRLPCLLMLLPGACAAQMPQGQTGPRF